MPTILIVEDAGGFRDTLAACLRLENDPIAVAADGPDGLARGEVEVGILFGHESSGDFDAPHAA